MDLFVYGTLLDERLVVRLTGKRLEREPARLTGYRRIAPPRAYAYIVPDPQGVVDGAVLRGVDDAALAALDAYEDEGRLYQRVLVEVVVDGAARVVMTYVGVPGAHPARDRG